jgi:predicted Fe-Mo cluster-binding NifX family protein
MHYATELLLQAESLTEINAYCQYSSIFGKKTDIGIFIALIKHGNQLHFTDCGLLKGEKKMKVGFAVEVDNGLESTVYGHFGSAPAFIIIDTDLKQAATVNNTNAHHVHGACNPIMALGGNAVDAMVVGGIGAGAIVKLNSMGVKVFKAGALTVKENIALLHENKLQEVSMNGACQGHEGQCAH